MKTSTNKSPKAASRFLSLASLLFVTTSLFFFIWKNLLYSGWTSTLGSTTPIRWVSATVLPVLIVSWGHGRRSLSTSAALLALVVGFTLSLAHYSFLASLLFFFISSSKATKYRQDVEKTAAEDFKRDWLQVLCNGFMATQLALLYLLDIGSADLPVDFRHQYRASWLGMAVLGAVSCCNGDTWASELGSVVAKGDPFLITTLQRVPKGTHGAVSIAGLVASFLGGLVIGVAYYVGIFFSATSADLAVAPNQLVVILVGAVGGLLGSLLDSLIGATLQFSGQDLKTGRIVEVISPGVVGIAGKQILDNHSVNLVSSIVTALVLPKVALAMGM